MASPVPDSPHVRFGPYELDPSAGRLIKAGILIKLQPQPFRVLQLLTSRPGQVVTREEIRRHLWGDSTFVDFERGINFSINQIRAVLCDNAETPRYIETLPRVGYRFMGALEPLNGDSGKTPAPAEVSFLPGMPTGSEWSPKSDDIAVVNPPIGNWTPLLRTKLLIGLAAAFVVLAALISLFAVFWRSTAPAVRLTGVTQITNDGSLKRGPLRANGGLLYYNRRVGETWEVAEVSAASGVSAAVPGSRGFVLTDMSSDGTELLLGPLSTVAAPIYSLALPNGSPRRIGSIETYDAAWSPNGRELAYQSGNQILVANRDGSGPRTVVTAPGAPAPISWSPDGRLLRFTVNDLRADRLSIWEVGSDGTRPHRLLETLQPQPGEWGVCCGHWTSDSRYYVFQSDRNGIESPWAVREPLTQFFGASVPVPLTTGGMRVVASLPSGDGTKLYAIGLVQRGELARYDKESQRFVPLLKGLSAVGVSFSRDGQWIAYIIFPDRILWRSRADGSEPLQLTFKPMAALSPQWSPDGTQIVFSGQLRGTPFHIYSVSPQGGAPQQLTKGDVDEISPSFGALNDEIIFGTAADLKGNTGGIHRLHLPAGPEVLLPGSSPELRAPQCSSQGRYVLALDKSRKIVLFDVQDQTWRRLTDVPVDRATWSPDGQDVYFASNHLDGRPAAYRIHLADHAIEKVALMDDLKRPSYGGFSWIGVAPDGSFLAFQDASSSELYAFDWQAP